MRRLSCRGSLRPRAASISAVSREVGRTNEPPSSLRLDPIASRQGESFPEKRRALLIKRTYLWAAALLTAGTTLALAIVLSRFSRFHVVEDYLPTDSGVGLALVRVFPQEQNLLLVAAALAVLGLGLIALQVMQNVALKREGQ